MSTKLAYDRIDYNLYRKSERVRMAKSNIIFAIISLLLGMALMHFLPQVFFVGMLIFFILIAFQTPSTKFDPTGEANDASINMLKVIGLNALLFVAGGYIAAIFF